MSKVILICGLSGSGKTTLAQALSEELNIPAYHKDLIKEQLYDDLGLKTLDDSISIGKRSVELLLSTAEQNITKGQNIIIEGPFRFAEDYIIFKDWIKDYDLQWYSVLCEAHPELKKQRFFERIRHPAHHDHEREYSEHFNAPYDQLPGTVIKLNTDKPVTDLIAELRKSLL